MTDQPPPPKPKPGSLRDRIAAFEKPASGAAPGPPPAPRPKPGGLSWKPKVPSPPSSPGTTVDHGSTPERKVGGMSASDAKESIGKGGSLKERMAALQGRGGFGAPPPVAPKPALEKPKWKPPPVISPPLEDDKDESDSIHDGESIKSPPPDFISPEVEAPKPASDDDEAAPPPEGEGQTEEDPEEEERQRRAAIAARMARLGGARVGMTPPVFGKKLSVKKAETPKEEAPKDEEAKSLEGISSDTLLDASSIKSPPLEETSTKSDAEPAPDYFISRKKSGSSLRSVDSGTQAVRTPNSMPVPAAPRRAGPPRKKVVKSPSPPPAPKILDGELQESPDKVDADEPSGTEAVIAESKRKEMVGLKEKEIGEIPEEAFEPTTVVKCPVPPVDDLTTDEASAISETPAPDHHLEEDHTEEKEVDAPKPIEEPSSYAEGPTVDDEPEEHEPEEHEPAPVVARDFIAPDSKQTRKHSLDAPSHSDELVEKPLEDPAEAEDDEVARRKRVAEKLAKMGGINPFAPPPPPQRKASASSEDIQPRSPASLQKRTSVGSVDSPKSPERRESLRKYSVDSTTLAENAPLPPRSPEILKSPVQLPTRKDSLESTGSGGNVSDNVSRRKSQDDSHSGKGFEHGKVAPPGIPEEADVPEDEDETPADDELPDRGHEHSQELDDGERDESEGYVDEPEEEFDSRDFEESHERNDDDQLEVEPPQTLPPPPPSRTTRPVPDMPTVEPVVGQPTTSLHPRPPPRSVPDFSEEDVEDEDLAEPVRVASPQRSVPLPPRLVPQTPEDENEDDNEAEPVHVTSPRRSIPPAPHGLETHAAHPDPPRRLPPRPVPEDDDDASEESAPLPHPQRRSIPPPRSIPHSAADDTEPGIESMTSSRPSRTIPPPPPPPPPESPSDDELAPPKTFQLDEEALPTPPRRSLPTPSQDEGHSAMTSSRKETDEHISPVPPPPARRALPPQPRSSAQQSYSSEETSPTQLTPTLSVSDQEILDESEGDPIDPAFHSPSRRASSAIMPSPPLSHSQEPSAAEEEDTEHLRRQTIAERMAKLGGIRFGAAPPAIGRPPPPPRAEEESSPEATTHDETSEHTELTEEEEEQARKQRIASKLAGMGGMRFGMLPQSVGSLSQQHSHAKREDTEDLPAAVSSHPPHRAAPPPRPPPSQPQEPDSEHESQATSDDGVKVEAEESELEEVSYEEAEEAPPPVPIRVGRHTPVHPTPQDPPARRTSQPPAVPTGRPPVPLTIPNRKPSVKTTIPTSRSSGDSGFSHPRSSTSTQKQQPEYVMVDDPKTFETDDAPPPPPRPTGRAPAPRGVPPPPPPPPPPTTAVEPSDSIASQWELPSIPSATLDFDAPAADLSLSTWSEDSTTYPTPASPPPPPPEKPVPARSSQLPQPHKTSHPPPEEIQLSSDDLMAVWGRVGVQICEVATALFEKSKKSLVGDGTYTGFVDAVLSEVPNALSPSPPSYGYPIYVQAGTSVQKRASEILPGDIVALYDAKLKGHKGIQTYHQTVGAGEPLVGIVSEFEPKKSKIRVFQANQHVGQQTVESVSYRLEDLKSGIVKIFRVLEA